MTEGWFLEVKFTVGLPMSRNFLLVAHLCGVQRIQKKNNILEIQKSWDLQLQEWLKKRWQTLRKPIWSCLDFQQFYKFNQFQPFESWGTSDPYHVGFHAAIPGVHTQSHGHPKKFVLLPPRRMESCWVCRNVRKSAREDHCIDWGEGWKPENQDNLLYTIKKHR